MNEFWGLMCTSVTRTNNTGLRTCNFQRHGALKEEREKARKEGREQERTKWRDHFVRWWILWCLWHPVCSWLVLYYSPACCLCEVSSPGCYRQFCGSRSLIQMEAFVEVLMINNLWGQDYSGTSILNWAVQLQIVRLNFWSGYQDCMSHLLYQ